MPRSPACVGPRSAASARMSTPITFRRGIPSGTWAMGGKTLVTAYKGLVYVDRDTEMILKLTLDAEDVPRTFPIQEARDSLDYANPSSSTRGAVS